MKKLIIYIILILSIVTINAQEVLKVLKKDGTTTQYLLSEIDSLIYTTLELNAPLLITPLNNSVSISLTPSLVWSAITGSTYTLQLSLNSGFTSYVYSQSGLTGTSKTVTDLNINTKYYWRVNATNSYGTSGWSGVWNFTTIDPTILTVQISGGTFIMGSPVTEVGRETNETQHQVTLSSFRLSKYEITNAQFSTFLNAKGIGANGLYPGGAYPLQVLIFASSDIWNFGLNYIGGQWVPVTGYENNPIINVTWYGATEFATYAGGRLPTESEWEYACRGTVTTPPPPFNTGSCLSNLQANYNWLYPYSSCTNTNTTPLDKTQQVGTYSSNIYGLYDMHGNVWEWCSDWYGVYPTTPQTNPTGPATGQYRVLRGGGWESFAIRCRSAFRGSNNPDIGWGNLGFRVVFVP